MQAESLSDAQAADYQYHTSNVRGNAQVHNVGRDQYIYHNHNYHLVFCPHHPSKCCFFTQALLIIDPHVSLATMEYRESTTQWQQLAEYRGSAHENKGTEVSPSHQCL